jgi:hypothetical protein
VPKQGLVGAGQAFVFIEIAADFISANAGIDRIDIRTEEKFTATPERRELVDHFATQARADAELSALVRGFATDRQPGFGRTGDGFSQPAWPRRGVFGKSVGMRPARPIKSSTDFSRPLEPN